jgi:hypothetical protein
LTLPTAHAILTLDDRGECDALNDALAAFCFWGIERMNEPVLVLNRNFEPLNV